MLPTIAITRWSIDMAAKKRPAQTTAPLPPPPLALPLVAPEVVSNNLSILRVENGFLLDVNLGDAFNVRDRRRMVAKDAAELARIVTTWATPPAKKR